MKQASFVSFDKPVRLETDHEPSGGTFGGTRATREKYFSGNVASVKVSSSSGRNSMVECQLPKLKVASSSLVARSNFAE